MDFAKIKNLVKGNGEKVILVEHDEPEVVVMSFAEYEKLTNGRPGAEIDSPARDMVSNMTDRSFPDKDERGVDIALAAQDDLEETEFIRSAPAAPDRAFLRPEEIRLEDLPL